MKRFLLLLLLAGCPKPAQESAPPTPVPAPAPAAAPKAAPDASAPITCGTKVCTPPEKCITVVGMQQGSAREECWIQCATDSDCPSGMGCSMISDGPGQVCLKR